MLNLIDCFFYDNITLQVTELAYKEGYDRKVKLSPSMKKEADTVDFIQKTKKKRYVFKHFEASFFLEIKRIVKLKFTDFIDNPGLQDTLFRICDRFEGVTFHAHDILQRYLFVDSYLLELFKAYNKFIIDVNVICYRYISKDTRELSASCGKNCTQRHLKGCRYGDVNNPLYKQDNTSFIPSLGEGYDVDGCVLDYVAGKEDIFDFIDSIKLKSNSPFLHYTAKEIYNRSIHIYTKKG